VKRNSCAVAPLVSNLTQSCALASNIINEDDADYCAAWEEETELTSGLPSCNYPEFKYSTAAAIQGYPILARQGWRPKLELQYTATKILCFYWPRRKCFKTNFF
jgi:hypothetical protein